MTAIQFGTSGHRGIYPSTFTKEHVVAIAQAVSMILKENTPHPKIVIGYDPRKGNDPPKKEGSLTHALVETLTTQGIEVFITESYCPTPIVSWLITKKGYDGGFILTASHNPPAYNGLKFNPKNGAPAPSELTQKIETLANTYLKTPPPSPTLPPKQEQIIAPISEFIEHLYTLINTLLKINTLNVQTDTLCIDVRHGACGETWQKIAQKWGFKAHILNETPRSDFGNQDPNPTKESNLDTLRTHIKSHKSLMGIANDPDGDRHVILDETGALLSPEETAVIIADALSPSGKLSGIVTTLASSKRIEIACKRLGIQKEETAVGFKYFAPFLEACKAKNTLGIGVESSGGMSISSHTLEKCGFLPPLLLLAISKLQNIPISQLKANSLKQDGRLYFKEEEYLFEPHQKENLVQNLKTATIETLQKESPLPVISLNQKDGLKLEFPENQWLLIRLSGTEPLARLYVESPSDTQSDQLLALAKTLINTFLKSA